MLHAVGFQLWYGGRGRNFGGNSTVSGCRGWRGRAESKQDTKDFEGSDDTLWYYNAGGTSLHLSRPSEHTTPRVTHYVCSGRWGLGMHARRFTWGEERTVLAGDARNGGSWVSVWAGIYRESLYLPLSFVVDLKLLFKKVLKNKMQKKKILFIS